MALQWPRMQLMGPGIAQGGLLVILAVLGLARSWHVGLLEGVLKQGS